jgi:hypothetical protein
VHRCEKLESHNVFRSLTNLKHEVINSGDEKLSAGKPPFDKEAPEAGAMNRRTGSHITELQIF